MLDCGDQKKGAPRRGAGFSEYLFKFTSKLLTRNLLYRVRVTKLKFIEGVSISSNWHLARLLRDALLLGTHPSLVE